MSARKDSEALLTALKSKYRSGEWPSQNELAALLRLSRSTEENLREAALILLLHPPVPDELSYYRWLFSSLAVLPKRLEKLPPPLVEVICELVAFVGKIPEIDRHISTSFQHLLRRLPRFAFPALLEKSFLLRPFLEHGRIESWILPKITPALLFKRRWRLFRKRFLNIGETPQWAEITLRDLKPFLGQGGSRGRSLARKGRWLAFTRPLLLPVHRHPSSITGEGANGFTEWEPSRHHLTHWGGFGPATLRFCEALVQSQARELQSIREMARRVSENTRRVVLSWHNATLAAAGGWSFESLNRSFPSESLWRDFQERVFQRVKEMENERGCNSGAVEHLWKMKEKRLVLPKVMHALWESRIRASFDRSWQSRWEKDYETAKGYLEPECLLEILVGKRYGWHGVVSPHQMIGLDQVLTLHEGAKTVWRSGLMGLRALIQEGQRFLDEGRLHSFVLPWIDKFFISSLREGDHEYLPRLVEWIEGQGVEPIILFWEDTAHAEAPSFQLALEGLRDLGCSYRGIGVFDLHGSKHETALEIIRNEHHRLRLFALRPFGDHHHRVAFGQLLQSKDPRFFQTYDSSWKDNLCFLYTGTQVAPLLSVQCEMEPFPGWMATEWAKYPFGAYFRGRLRWEVLGKFHSAGDHFSRCYALWANLG